MAKTVLPSKLIEWKGLDAIHSTVHEMNCIFREITKDDFGIDGEIELTTQKSNGRGYETTGRIIKVQAKSGTSYVKQDSANSFTTPVNRSDLESWNRSNFPIILVIYNPTDDKLYWRHIQSYTKENPVAFQPPLKIEFQKPQDEFNIDCYQELCRLADFSPPRVDFSKRERLFTNRLLVKKQPQILTCAPTEYKSGKDVRGKLRRKFIPPFCIQSGHLFTLSDLRAQRCNLREFCDSTRISDVMARKWIDDTLLRNDYVYLLNQLLAIHSRRCGLKYNPVRKLDYFPRENGTDTEFKRVWHNVRTDRESTRTVVKYYDKYGSDRFWRHRAVDLRFKFVDKSLFLELVPRYLFTADGESLWESEKIGPYTTRIKAQERNSHFLTDVLFWSDTLSRGEPEIELQLDRRTAMVIGKLPLHGIADFAITLDPAASYEEPDDVGQLDFFDFMPEGDDNDEEDFVY